MKPLDEERHPFWNARIEGYIVAPFAAGACHLPEHLGLVPAGDLSAQNRVDVRSRVGAFDFDQAIVAHEAVWARTTHADGGMGDVCRPLDLYIDTEFVGCPSERFV